MHTVWRAGGPTARGWSVLGLARWRREGKDGEATKKAKEEEKTRRKETSGHE